jgi:hypothetical protein
VRRLLVLLALLLVGWATSGVTATDATTPRASVAVECPFVEGTESYITPPDITRPDEGAVVTVDDRVVLEAATPFEGPNVLAKFLVSDGATLCAGSPYGTATAEHVFRAAGEYTIGARTLQRSVVVDAVSAQSDWYESEGTSSATITVLPPPREPELVVKLGQRASTGPVGSTLSWSGTVTLDGKPVSGASVRFAGTLAGAADEVATVRTDAEGVARHTHTREVAGTESLRVSTTVGEQSDDDAGSFTWVPLPDPELQVELTQDGVSAEVGSTLTWTATVTLDGEPVSGAGVRFLGTLPGAADEDVTRSTDSSGRATHQHTRTVPGTETLQVSTTVEETSDDDSGSFTWLPPPEPDLQLELAPADSSGPVGSNPVWTATVTVDGDPVDGAVVDFLGELSGQADVVAAGVLTDAEGVATHTHTREIAGEETLTATTTVAGRTATDEASRTWTAPPTSPEPSDPPTITDPPVTEPPVTTPPPTPTPTPTPTTPPPVVPDEPDEDDTTTIPPTGAEPPPLGAEDLDEVTLGRDSVLPGGDAMVSGSGCPPGSTVQVLLADEVLGTTTADDEGSFALRVPVPNVPLGQYVVRVECGNAYGEAVLDLVSTVASSTAPAAAASAAAVLGFFVLLGSSVLKGTFGHGPGPVGG